MQKTHLMDVSAVIAAASVKRLVPEYDKENKPTGKTIERNVDPDEVLACRVTGNQLVVVTTDGQKLTGAVSAPKEKSEKPVKEVAAK